MLHADIIPSHTVAQWLLSHIHRLLDWFGLARYTATEEFIYVTIIILAAIGIGWVLSNLIRVAMRKVIMVKNPDLGRQLVGKHVLSRCSGIIPPLFVLAMLPFALEGKSLVNTVLLRITLIYTVVAITIAIISVTSFVWIYFEEKRNTKNLPLRGILDTIIGILWTVAIIICVAIIVDKSPAVLLGGLGAFAAVLMLVFKDSILGLVAGLQLSQNDMLHVGDWIVVPSTIANGIVTDVSLTTIKVQNWDNTIVTLPPYTLISGSFQNWRGMSDSGCRQIARTLLFDNYSITPLTSDDLAKILSKYPSLQSFADATRKAGHPMMNPATDGVNGTIDTNMGLFRAYMCQWLLDNPNINHTQQILVRLMQPTENGTPLQIWCFTATTAWTAYEAIQSALFEHMIAVAPDFGLRVFNYTSGADVLTVQPMAAAKVEGASLEAPQPPAPQP